MWQVLDLKEPVEDERGFVYEKAAIEAWIASRGQGDNPVDAPFAGGESSASCQLLCDMVYCMIRCIE